MKHRFHHTALRFHRCITAEEGDALRFEGLVTWVERDALVPKGEVFAASDRRELVPGPHCKAGAGASDARSKLRRIEEFRDGSRRLHDPKTANGEGVLFRSFASICEWR